jgi:hypothetical protein
MLHDLTNALSPNKWPKAMHRIAMPVNFKYGESLLTADAIVRA